MSKSISESLLNTMREWVELHLGHRISQSRLEDFEKRVLLASAEAGFEEPSEFIASLIRGGENNEAVSYMALYLTIGETYFFRDAMSYSVLKASILPEVLKRKKPGERLSIWSAGCSSGEEPYSIAMTAMTVLSDFRGEVGPIEARILATDVNKQSLKVARSGIYRRWSFRDIPAFIKEKYFTIREDETYALKEEVKSRVDFAMLNLAEDGYPSIINGTDNLDIIFCRNVLIYFSPEQVTNTLLKFHKCLRPGGWLFLAPSEIPHPAPKFFHVQNLNGAIVMQKVEEIDIKEKAPIKIVHSNYSYFGSTREDMSLSIDNLIEAPSSMPESTEPPIEMDFEDLQSKLSEFYDQGKYSTIIEALPQISTSMEHSDSSETLGLIARSFANLGNLEAAIDWCDRLIAQDTINARWYYLKATIHHEMGDDEAALRSLTQSIFLDESYVIAYFVLGNLHRQRGEKEKSSKCFSKVARLLQEKTGADIVQDSDGLTVGQLKSIVSSLGGDNQI